MINPFIVLDLPVTATDEEVRAAYQRLLRKYPPEQRPREFQIIQEAYTSLRTRRDRLKWRLFHLQEDWEGPQQALDEFTSIPGILRPPGAAAFRAYLTSCAAAAKRGNS